MPEQNQYSIRSDDPNPKMVTMQNSTPVLTITKDGPLTWADDAEQRINDDSNWQGHMQLWQHVLKHLWELHKLKHGHRGAGRAAYFDEALQRDVKESRDGQDYVKVWNDFWKELCTNEDGTINLDAVQRELSDYHVLLAWIPRVYDSVTGGMITKPFTWPSVVISVAEDHVNDVVEDALKDERGENEVQIQMGDFDDQQGTDVVADGQVVGTYPNLSSEGSETSIPVTIIEAKGTGTATLHDEETIPKAEHLAEVKRLQDTIESMCNSARTITDDHTARTRDALALREEVEAIKERLRFKSTQERTPPIGKYVEVLRVSGYSGNPFEILTAKWDPNYKGWTDLANDRITDSGYDPIYWRELSDVSYLTL